jgi:hypothetical protein
MFDPYQAWLGITKEHQPPNYYQLLGVSPQERDRKVIEEAMIRQMSRVRIYQGGPQARLCSDLLNQIAEAGTVLLDAAKRQRYDEQLQRPAAGSAPSTPATAGTAPSVLRGWPIWTKIAAFAIAGLFFLSGFAVFLLAVILRRKG